MAADLISQTLLPLVRITTLRWSSISSAPRLERCWALSKLLVLSLFNLHEQIIFHLQSQSLDEFSKCFLHPNPPLFVSLSPQESGPAPFLCLYPGCFHSDIPLAAPCQFTLPHYPLEILLDRPGRQQPSPPLRSQFSVRDNQIEKSAAGKPRQMKALLQQMDENSRTTSTPWGFKLPPFNSSSTESTIFDKS